MCKHATCILHQTRFKKQSRTLKSIRAKSGLKTSDFGSCEFCGPIPGAKAVFYKLRTSFAASHCFRHLIARLEPRDFHRAFGSCMSAYVEDTKNSLYEKKQLQLYDGMTPRIQVDVLWSTSWHNVFEEFLCHLHSKRLSQFAWIFGSFHDFVIHGQVV